MPLTFTGERVPTPIEGVDVSEPPVAAADAAGAVAAARPFDPTPIAGVSATAMPSVAAADAAGAVAAARPFDPTPIAGVSATAMPPVAAAGVTLVRSVLRIATAAIAGLILYLLLSDLIIGHDINGSYNAVLNPSRIGTEFYTLGKLEKLSIDLNTAASDPNWAMPPESVQNAQSVFEMLGRLPSVTSTQKSWLRACLPLPSGETRGMQLQRCMNILDGVRQSALEAASSTTNAEVAGTAADKFSAQRQTFHAFWLQAAQLVLLNLLLPILTALLGYIFGSQQRAG